MEESSFNVESGLESGALLSAGTASTLVLPHTIPELREDDIPENIVPAPAPAPAPEPRPIPDMGNNENPRVPGDQRVMTRDEFCEYYLNSQSSYAPSPNEDPPVDDDDDLTEEEEETVSSKRRRTGEHDQKLAGKAALEAEESSEHPDPIETPYTNEIRESMQQPEQYVSSCSPPESTSTDASEALDITTPALEPLFMVSTDSKAEGVGEKQAQGACEEQAQGVGEEQARDGGEER